MPHSGVPVSEIVAMIDADTALRSPSQGEVGVKPLADVSVKGLEWHGDKFGRIAESLLGTWWVRNPFSDGRVQLEGPFGHTMHDSMEAALAAAEATYRQCILSALEPQEAEPGQPDFYALHSPTRMHIGLWPKRDDAYQAAREYEGCTVTPLYLHPAPKVGEISDEMVERFGRAFWGSTWRRGGFETIRAALSAACKGVE